MFRIVFFLFSFILAGVSFGQSDDNQDKIVEVTTKSEIENYLKEKITKNNLPAKYARSIFQIQVDYNGAVLRMRSINHPYDPLIEAEMKDWLSAVVWTNLKGGKSFFLIIEIQDGIANVNYKRNK